MIQHGYRILAETSECIASRATALQEALLRALEDASFQWTNRLWSTNRDAYQDSSIAFWSTIEQSISLHEERMVLRPRTDAAFSAETGANELEVIPKVCGATLQFDLRAPDLKTNAHRVATVSLRGFATPLLSKGGFDDVAVIGTDAQVLVHMPSGPLAGAELPNAPPDWPVRTAGTTNAAGLRGLVDWTMRLSGSEYYVLATPLRLFPDSTNVWNAWLCGLLRADAVARQTHALPTPLVLCAAFVLTLLVFSCPLVSVCSFVEHHPLTPGRVLLFLLAAVASIATCTTIAVHSSSSRHTALWADERLDAIGMTIHSNLMKEVRLLYATVSACNSNACLIAKKPDITNWWSMRETNLFGNTNINLVLDAAQPQGGTPPYLLASASQPTNSLHPYFRYLWWADAKSNILFKWTAAPLLTPNGRIGGVAAYWRILKNLAWGGTNFPMNVFYLEPLFSGTRGEMVGLYSQAVGSGDFPDKPRTGSSSNTNRTRPAVIAMEVQLQSLMNPTLPAGFGFAVVTREGRVLFHSDSSLNLRETNFFAECDDHPHLRALVTCDEISAVKMNKLSGVYHGQRVRFAVHSLPPLPWRVVLFRDKGVLDGFHQESLTMMIVLLAVAWAIPGMFIILGMVVWMSLHASKPGALHHALWSASPRLFASRGGVVCGFLFAALLAGLAAIGSSTPQAVLWVIGLLFPTLALAAWGLLQVCCRETEPDSERPATHAAETVAGLLLCVAAVPVLAFATICHREEMTCYARGTGVVAEQDLEQRKERLLKDWENKVPRLAERRVQLPWDLYLTGFRTNSSNVAIAQDGSLGALDRLYRRARVRLLALGTPGDMRLQAPFLSNQGPPKRGEASLDDDLHRLVFKPWNLSDTRGALDWLWPVVVGLVVTAALAMRLAYFIVRDVFLYDVRHRRPPSSTPKGNVTHARLIDSVLSDMVVHARGGMAEVRDALKHSPDDRPEGVIQDLPARVRHHCTVYQNWWAECSHAEKVCLFHVARRRFVGDSCAVRSLRSRGWIAFEPELRIENAGFQEYVLLAFPLEQQSQSATHERDLSTQLAGRLLKPAMLFVLLLLLGVGVFKPNALKEVTALAAAVGAAMGGLLTLGRFISPDKQQA